MNLRRAILLTALALVGTLVFSGVAGAANVKKIKSHVKITKTHPKFEGKVSSPNKACIANRTVKLYAVEPGNVVVGTDKTNSKGRWSIQFQGEGVVHYYAKVLRSEQGTAGTTYVCKHDRTPKTAARAGSARSARGIAYDTDLKLSAKFPAFHGSVRSPADACEPARKVRLYKKKLGQGESNDKKLGVDLTDGKGRWKVKVDDLGSGAYYAKVSKLQNASIDFRCKAAKSSVAVVD